MEPSNTRNTFVPSVKTKKKPIYQRKREAQQNKNNTNNKKTKPHKKEDKNKIALRVICI